MFSSRGDRERRGRRIEATSAGASTLSRTQPLSRAPVGPALQVVRVLRPVAVGDRTWELSILRLEELGIFPGQEVQKLGSTGPRGATILKAGGTRVALSRELSGVVMVGGQRTSSSADSGQ